MNTRICNYDKMYLKISHNSEVLSNPCLEKKLKLNTTNNVCLFALPTTKKIMSKIPEKNCSDT